MNIKIDSTLFAELLSQAHTSPRKRSHRNLHRDLNEPVQRLLIGLTKGTYVRPHHHPNPIKWELMLALRGKIALVIFDKDGTVLERYSLSPGESVCGMEIKPGTWHTLFPESDEAVLLEVKQGPYTPTDDKDFAAWAPAEGDAGVEKMIHWLESAQPGDKFTT